MALKLDILANTRQFVSESKKAGASLDDISDSLEDVAREARAQGGKTERALDDIGDAGKDTARDIDTAGGKMERTFRELVKDAKKADTAVEQVGDSGKAGFGKAKEGAQELSSEIGSNLGEAVSSFRGDLSDLGQVGQDTLGGLAATLASAGPAGIAGAAALAAGAAGLGLVTAALDNTKAKQEEVSAAAAEWADSYLTSAGLIVDASSVVANVQAQATDPDRYKKAEENARDWGVTVETAMLAIAGDATSLEVVQESLNAKQERWVEVLKEATSATSEGSYDRSKMTAEEAELGREVERGTEALGLQNDAMREGRTRAENAAGAMFRYAQRVGKATGETDKLGNKIIRLPDGKEIVIDAKTGRAYEDIETLEKKKIADKTATVDVKVNDKTTAEVDRIVSRINRRTARITINGSSNGISQVV